MEYRIIIPKIVQKQLRKLPATIYERIVEKIALLAGEPRPAGVKKLKGFENEYRIRIGDYRVRYEINDKQLTIIILSCRHRRESYRD
ncbi:MAG: type II toxin-antitoxin system RelE/ParE family toxin [Xenococcaceae cyanobacterium MO_167.B52]|nr:type II toxin-antitoxin system RelE/ParE family toxin [Xenococcaceae cyanobacterium MO_167.B52]